MNLKQLIQMACREQTPATDVRLVSRVLASLASPAPPNFRPLTFLASGAAMAATVLLSLALVQQPPASDPQEALFASVEVTWP